MHMTLLCMRSCCWGYHQSLFHFLGFTALHFLVWPPLEGSLSARPLDPWFSKRNPASATDVELLGLRTFAGPTASERVGWAHYQSSPESPPAGCGSKKNNSRRNGVDPISFLILAISSNICLLSRPVVNIEVYSATGNSYKKLGSWVGDTGRCCFCQADLNHEGWCVWHWSTKGRDKWNTSPGQL